MTAPRPKRVGQQRLCEDTDRPQLDRLPPVVRRRILRLLADIALQWVRRPPAGGKDRDHDRDR